MICWKCDKPNATAPDCEHRNDYIHFKCLSPARQQEELRWLEEDSNAGITLT